MTATVQKFMFDTTFDEVPEPEPVVPEPEEPEKEEQEPEIIVPTFSEEELAAAREEGFAAGKQEGQQETSVSVEARIAEMLVVIDAKYQELFQTQKTDSEEMSRAAVTVATDIAHKIVPTMAESAAMNEIERVIQSVFEKVVEEPNVTVNVNPELADSLRGRIENMNKSRTYEGNIHVQPNETVPVGDCRLEWSSGGTERDTAALWRDIDEIVDRHLEGRPTVLTRPDETATGQPETGALDEETAPEIEAETETETENTPETDD